ncbi:MAG: ribosomal protein S18-alanine N-acetyltransferase [Roseburia sp.]|nr:ribosomal protein S18-alanine N-acetyltransferase [Roseburia sp.]
MIIVRTMTEQDCSVVAELEKKIFSQPWSEQGFVDALSMEQNIFLVAEEEGKVCGYIGMYQSLDEGEITNVAVALEKRNAGIGRMLMQAALEEAEKHGIVQVVLEVRVSNASAIHLYEQCGFVNCGIRKGFYDFPKEDAYIMIRNQ